MRFSTGCNTKDMGGESRTKATHREPLSYSGDTYERDLSIEPQRGGVSIGVSWPAIKKRWGNCEGSLANLHLKQPIRWPYDLCCLGVSSEYDSE